MLSALKKLQLYAYALKFVKKIKQNMYIFFWNAYIMDKRTVSIKRTVFKFLQMTLLNVLYDLKNETIIT